VVQTVTSSVIYSSGSNVFGNNIANTQVFTGSMNLTGSLTVTTIGTELQVTSTGVNLGNALTDSHVISGSVRINPNGLFVSGSGNVGINSTNLDPNAILTIAPSGFGVTGSSDTFIHLAGDTTSKLTFKVDNILRAQVDANGVTAGNLNMTGNTLSSTSSGITLDPNTGQVLVDGYLQLAIQGSDPAAVASNDMLYHKTIGAGDSGLFFTTTTRNDELVSKRRAILFGMIF
jgi:hypothetical protein